VVDVGGGGGAAACRMTMGLSAGEDCFTLPNEFLVVLGEGYPATGLTKD
jgi:hypothetical protein